MQCSSFEEAVEQILAVDSRYSFEAYVFVREALDYTVRTLKKPRTGPEKHVSGQELLEGVRQYALADLGPVAHTVLTTWGIRSTEDFGEIVFHLVDKAVLAKCDSDTKADFANGYDFDTAFVAPFLPKSGKATPGTGDPALRRRQCL